MTLARQRHDKPAIAAARPGDIGADTHTWTGVIRRARLAPTVKLIALTVASYADPDGTKVYPGLARLVYECGVGYSTARRALADLRAAGLIERVRRGNRRRKQADEYRLVLAEDLLDRVAVPSPEEARVAVESISAHWTGAGRVRQQRISAHVESGKPASRGPVPVDNSPVGDQQPPPLALTQTSHRTRSNAHLDPTLALSQMSAHLPYKAPDPERDRPSLLAGDLTSPSTGRPHQPPILGVIEGGEPDHPVDDYQLMIPVELPPPRAEPAEVTWAALGTQLARINERPP